MNIPLRFIAAALVTAHSSCGRHASRDITEILPNQTPVELTHFDQEVYRSTDNQHIVALISPTELKFTEYGFSQLCKYKKQQGALHIDAMSVGNSTPPSFRIVPQGLQSSEGQILYSRSNLEALRNATAAIEESTRSINANPNDIRAHCRRGFAYYKMGNLENAASDLDEAVKNDSVEMNATNIECTEALRSDPKNAIAYCYRGRTGKSIESRLGDFAEAIRLDPALAPAYFYRSLFYAELNDCSKALIDAREASRLDPKLRDRCFLRLGQKFDSDGRIENAIKCWNEAMRLEPSLPGSYNSLAWTLSTSPDDSVRNGKLAVEYALKACGLAQGKGWQFLDTLAAAYAEAGDYEKAVTYENRAIAMTAMSEPRNEMRHRLSLYTEQRPYRQPENLK